MKKIIAFFILVLTALFYYLSSNRPLNGWYYKIKANNYYTSSQRFKYGDLYAQTYLLQFKFKNESFKLTKAPKKELNTRLYLFSDSYTFRRISSENLIGVDSIIYFKWFDHNTAKSVKLDTSKKNIIVFEIVERSFREIFNKIENITIYLNTDNSSVYKKIEPNFKQTYISCLFEPTINQNLENNLFDNGLFLKFRELKASLNYQVFNRISGDAVISNNKQYLFYKPTIDKNLINSSFNQLPEKEIEVYIFNLNSIYTFYKNMGFDEIFLSIIPNPVSILESERGEYNHLIERIQMNPKLKMPYIDIYSEFSRNQEGIYLHHDSHWTNKGLQLWVNSLNHKIYN